MKKKPQKKAVRVKVPPGRIAHVEVPPGHIAVVSADPKTNVVEIVPVKREKKQGWMEYLFGPD